jgi:hypothetical protein
VEDSQERSICRLINATNGKRPPQRVITSVYVLTACSTGHDSLPRPREARGGEGPITPADTGREREGVGGAAGGERYADGVDEV